MNGEFDNTRTNHDAKVFSQQCPYFDDGRVSTVEAFTAHYRDISWYDKYLKLGYRRIADIYYKNVCSSCNRCISMRVLTSDFRLTKSQQKTYNKNADIVLEVKRPYQITEAQLDLYKRYIVKHGGNESEAVDNLHSMHLGYSHSMAMEYYIGDVLVAVSIVDETKEGLSSVYCYYDYKLEKRRLGVYTLIREIEYAKSLKKKYCYLGFYIKELNSMNYKSSFLPNEILSDGQWLLYK